MNYIDTMLTLKKSSLDVDVLQALRDRLVVTNALDLSKFPLFLEDNTYINVPRQSPIIRPEKLKRFLDKTCYGSARNLTLKLNLYDYQKEAVNSFLEGLKTYPYGGQVNAAAGSGKTIIGLALIAALKRTSLIVVNTTFLVDQWIERINQSFNNVRVGVVQQDQCEYGDQYDITIALCQSLVSRNYDPNFYYWPGIVMYDEVHRYAAKEWSKVCTKFPAKYRIGLTATATRNDGMSPVFFSHIGPVLAKVSRSRTGVIKPTIKKLVYGVYHNVNRYVLSNGKFNFSKWITDLAKDTARNIYIVSLIKKAVLEGRTVLVLSALGKDKHLGVLEDMITTLLPNNTIDYYIGGKSKEDLNIASKADVLLGTYKMASEGLDIPKLDTLILATPISNIEQSVGRIQRTYTNKTNAIVYDIVDNNPVANAMYNRRLPIYEKLNAEFI